MKKVGFIIFVSLSILILLFNVGEKQNLTEEKSIKQKVDDFILHMKIEQEKNGIRVHKSLQYIGEDMIQIYHQTPLISVSLASKNHDYTGSLVQKNLRKGNIYYQDTVEIPINQKGENTLYVEAKFLVDEDIVKIEHTEPLIFN